jgi:cytidylate kinase
MKKRLIMINGTMGVGKSTTCKELNKALDKSVWLDGDWCWMMNPFIVNDENKKMVEDNIIYLLRSFLTNSSYEYVIFSWVIHTEEIFDMLLKRINDLEYDLFKITLICSEESLKDRILKDIKNNLRESSTLKKGVERLPLYKNLDTIKIDTSETSISEVIDEIKEIIGT